jgi:hypothetical protein
MDWSAFFLSTGLSFSLGFLIGYVGERMDS